ncbi:hypothetical protein BD309DRAFT_956570 [Dichomitus squalens]|uniref:Uncharacterized protein n=1 Tax=Dichomitus squalens TaxID=114155 RepID=A0A4Q9Q499_9APHY|nr:hypothetical protein BD309DRAFT_956570 [Dichomitus squalens]TBU61444.1 hypothetical protein BD310DRAFT_195534 [Dichomitus squalens]
MLPRRLRGEAQRHALPRHTAPDFLAASVTTMAPWLGRYVVGMILTRHLTERRIYGRGPRPRTSALAVCTSHPRRSPHGPSGIARLSHAGCFCLRAPPLSSGRRASGQIDRAQYGRRRCGLASPSGPRHRRPTVPLTDCQAIAVHHADRSSSTHARTI